MQAEENTKTQSKMQPEGAPHVQPKKIASGSLVSQFVRPETTQALDGWKARAQSFSSYLEAIFKNLTRVNEWNSENAAVDPKGQNTWISLSDKYQEIEEVISRCFDSKLNTYLLLTGSRGRGRSSAVYHAVQRMYEKDKELIRNGHKIEKLEFLEYDAAQNDIDRSSLMNYLVNKLSGSQADEEVTDFEQKANFQEKLIKLLKDFRVVIYLKNVHLFAEQSRQVFLYTFLDSINQFAMKVVLIFNTSHLSFLNKLEKRVRSRFSFREINFEEVDFETMVKPVLIEKLTNLKKTSSKNNTTQAEEMLRHVLVSHKGIREVFERSIMLGQGLDKIILVVTTALGICDPEKLLYALEGSEETAGDFLYQKILEARKLQNYEGGDAELLQSLPKPAKLCILALSESSRQRKMVADQDNVSPEYYGIQYRLFSSKVYEIVSTKFESLGMQVWRTMAASPALMKDALITLSKMGMVHLSKTPIDNETYLLLSEAVSPYYISTQVKDNDIHFS